MLNLERLLEPGSTELPKCSCGEEMPHQRTRAATTDTEIRVFQCSECGRELHLTVWK